MFNIEGEEKMKKYILIAMVFVSLMLITPFTVVARENKISSNLSEQPDIDGLVAQIRVVIDEILQKYGHIPMVSHICDKLDNITFIFSWIYLLLYIIFVGIGLFLYVLLKFYDYYYWI